MNWPCKIQPSPLDLRDWKYSVVRGAAGTSNLLDRVDWTEFLPPVRDQGNEGTCAAHAGACVKEAQEKVDTGFNINFSPRFIYTFRANKPDDGMNLRDLMNIMTKYGVCTESLCPYEAGKPIDAVDDKMISEAAEFCIKSYALCNTISEVKSALVEQGPCVVAFPVYDFGPSFWKPKQAGMPAQGGHAVTIVGYNDSQQAFLIRNSWGESWNGNGYTWFPYSDWGAQWEVWSTVDKQGSRYKPQPIVVDKKGCC